MVLPCARLLTAKSSLYLVPQPTDASIGPYF